jgi:hypothetical protein
MLAGEAGAEVRGDAGRHPRQERGGGGQGQRPRQQGPGAAPPAARLAAAAVCAARGPRAGADGELGDVRPPVVGPVDVLVHGDDHGGRDHHLTGGRNQPDPAVQLGALLRRWRLPLIDPRRLLPCSSSMIRSALIISANCFFLLSILSPPPSIFLSFDCISISTKEQRPR